MTDQAKAKRDYPDIPKVAFTPPEAAYYLSLSLSQIYGLIYVGELPYALRGKADAKRKSYILPKAGLDAWLERNTQCNEQRSV